MSERAIVICLRAMLPTVVGAFLVAIAMLAARDTDRALHGAAAILAALYLTWILAEARITVQPPSQRASETSTLLPYALSRSATGLSAVLWPLPWNDWSWWMILPFGGFAAAVALRLWAIRILGRFYSHHVVRYSYHAIVSTGPYKYVRHPAYTGMLLAHAFFVAFFANLLSVLFLVVLMGCVLRRILVEEQALWPVPGYPAYAHERARLIPGVW
ncbi:methyltransferase family protein [Streptomyces sp. NPDC093595]|uniref:methyltransferase family protein n=1 Tax=Streptomyces sp. NPDC093595 TaxID=3366045 RepID=UPI00382FD971